MNEKCIRYLDIAGFLIKINLLKPDYEGAREGIIHMIDSYFMGFLVFPVAKKTKSDFTINIKPTGTYMFLDRLKNAFIRLYIPSDKPNSITTFYSISAHHFQLILMQVLFWLLARKGFLIHCSALNINGRAILFLGKQGAGKSTTVTLLSDSYETLADDTGIIREEGGNYYFYQGPSIEKIKNIKKTGKRYPIKEIFLLKKSNIYKTIKITNREYLFKKMSYQFLGDLKDMKEKVYFLFKMVKSFNGFYFLFFGKNKVRLKRVINNEHI